MRARLSDAAFFVAQDRTHRLDSRVAALGGVAFHAKLGSYGDKAHRMGALAAWLAPAFGVDATEAARAATLAKADLVTLTVGEFPELQGVMGRLLRPGTTASRTLWLRPSQSTISPAGASDDVAPSKLGALVAFADRVDTLVGCLAVGLRPTGSEDPFGLRRVASGAIRTLLQHRIRLSLRDATLEAWEVFARENGKMLASVTAAKGTRDDAVKAVLDFAAERLKSLLEERFPRDVVAACMAASRDNPVDVLERAEALAAFWENARRGRPGGGLQARVQHLRQGARGGLRRRRPGASQPARRGRAHRRLRGHTQELEAHCSPRGATRRRSTSWPARSARPSTVSSRRCS